jgi:predicted transcriptional regulator YdeE
MKEEKNEGVRQVEVTAKAFVDALIDNAIKKIHDGADEKYNEVLKQKQQREKEISEMYKFEVPITK